MGNKDPLRRADDKSKRASEGVVYKTFHPATKLIRDRGRRVIFRSPCPEYRDVALARQAVDFAGERRRWASAETLQVDGHVKVAPREVFNEVSVHAMQLWVIHHAPAYFVKLLRLCLRERHAGVHKFKGDLSNQIRDLSTKELWTTVLTTDGHRHHTDIRAPRPPSCAPH